MQIIIIIIIKTANAEKAKKQEKTTITNAKTNTSKQHIKKVHYKNNTHIGAFRQYAITLNYILMVTCQAYSTTTTTSNNIDNSM